MLKLETISIELKKINKEAQILSIKELIDKIDQEIKEQSAIYKPSDKKQLNTIKKYLNDSKLKSKPLLQCFTPLKDDRVAFTNSYSLFILNKKTLPFNVAFDATYSEDEKNDYLQKNNIDKKSVNSGVYPTLKNVIPDECNQIDTFKLNIDNFLTWYKVQDKKALKNKDILYNLSDDLNPYMVDATLLKEGIDIMQLSGVVSVEFYGDIKPCIIRTESGKNVFLLMPVKKY